MNFSSKFINKYMRQARQFGEDSNPCMSRKIGSIIINPETYETALGYNSPSRGMYHCDSHEYVDFFIDKLTKEEKCRLVYNIKTYGTQTCDISTSQNNDILMRAHFTTDDNMKSTLYSFLQSNKICPRRLIFKSGERLDTCTAIHSEVNAILNASFNVRGSSLFLWGPTPCLSCSTILIQKGLEEVYCLNEVYDNQAVILLTKYVKLFRLDWNAERDEGAVVTIGGKK